MDKAAFFSSLRQRNSGVFGTSLTRAQVAGCEAVLDECARQKADLGQTAYVLATTYGETGGAMQPRRENMNYSAKRIREVWPRRREAVKYARNPKGLANHVYNGRLGNRTGTDDGWDFRGAGLGQITGRDNFRKWGDRLGLDLINHPELLERLDISVKALVRPMLEGWATGMRLSQFVDGDRRDYAGARRVWNGTFEAAKYAASARAFEAALEAAGWGERPHVLPDVEPAPTAPRGTWWQNLSSMFAGRR